MQNNFIFSSPEPYPELENTSSRPEIVGALSNLYAGKDSEMTAILQYTFQHLIIHNSHPEIADILEEISEVEMRHLELLGEAIRAFGGLPYFNNAIGVPFSASYVKYCPNIHNFLRIDLEDEKNAVIAYTTVANQVDNPSLKRLLLRIAEDEQLHAQILSTVINDLERANTQSITTTSHKTKWNIQGFETDINHLFGEQNSYVLHRQSNYTTDNTHPFGE